VSPTTRSPHGGPGAGGGAGFLGGGQLLHQGGAVLAGVEAGLEAAQRLTKRSGGEDEGTGRHDTSSGASGLPGGGPSCPALEAT
jgi:hypothetical protein